MRGCRGHHETHEIHEKGKGFVEGDGFWFVAIPVGKCGVVSQIPELFYRQRDSSREESLKMSAD
jgi:hypothetical protein